MIWNSLDEFLAMGGYGLYVWGSMGVTFGALAIEVWMTRRGRNDALRRVRQEIRAAGMNKELTP